MLQQIGRETAYTKGKIVVVKGNGGSSGSGAVLDDEVRNLKGAAFDIRQRRVVGSTVLNYLHN